VRDAWYLSRYTGLFRASGAAERRAHDPDVAVWSGSPANRAVGGRADAVGGAAWTADDAELAAVGEAIERWQTHALTTDANIRGAAPPGAIDHASWVLFSAEQYAQPGFPFVAPTRADALDWVKFRRVPDGEHALVPAELAFMDLRPSARHRFTPAISTGWSAHSSLDRAITRGVQEVIERDALMGGWWGNYAVEAEPFTPAPALARRNLTYRAYRIDSPFSAHVTMVTVEGDDREGYCFSIGSACRDTRAASLEKASLEAVQGRHYVRYLRREMAAQGVTSLRTPRDFREHAVGYSLEPARLAATVLGRATSPSSATAAAAAAIETRADLLRRLGDSRAPLFRIMTPPAFVQHERGWYVVRVMLPGLQPMHGDHALPFLGGPLWRGRALAEWATIPPHPFA
jgi:thiazole/oxazole-forming peptide maturase SagD family component